VTADLFPQAAPAAYTCSSCGASLADEEAVLMHCCPTRLPLIAEAARLKLDPGDVLVLRIEGPPLSKEGHECAKRWLADQLPPGIHTLILSSRESLQVIKAPTAEAAP
jgi:hypothetical protein